MEGGRTMEDLGMRGDHRGEGGRGRENEGGPGIG